MKKGSSGGASGTKEKFAAFHAASSERTYKRMVHRVGRWGWTAVIKY
jgi:hypothetical protein